MTDFDFDLNGESVSASTIVADVADNLYLNQNVNSTHNQKRLFVTNSNLIKPANNTNSTNNEAPSIENQQQQQQQPQTNTLISSCSLSSSLSTSSSSSSSSSASTTPNSMTNPQQNLTAPLATISEFSNYNSLKYDSKSNNSDLTLADSTCNQQPASKNEANNAKNRKGSISSLNNMTANKTDANEAKYLSSSSINRGELANMSNLNTAPTSNSQTQKKAANTATNSGSSNNSKGIRNFFGKLIRTSLVNINESNFNMNLDQKHVEKAETLAKTPTDESTNKKQTSLNTTNSYFKRGGNRATANARLQNNTFSFSNSSLSVLKKNSTACKKTCIRKP